MKTKIVSDVFEVFMTPGEIKGGFKIGALRPNFNPVTIPTVVSTMYTLGKRRRRRPEERVSRVMECVLVEFSIRGRANGVRAGELSGQFKGLLPEIDNREWSLGTIESLVSAVSSEVMTSEGKIVIATQDVFLNQETQEGYFPVFGNGFIDLLPDHTLHNGRSLFLLQRRKKSA